MECFWIYVTAADGEEAGRLARQIVGERLAACANVLGAIRSVYWWEGRLCDGEEVALVFKTTSDRRDPLVERLGQLHSYECPCIVCLPVAGGSQDFLDWIEGETRGYRRP